MKNDKEYGDLPWEEWISNIEIHNLNAIASLQKPNPTFASRDTALTCLQ
jgi:hypothetical protein